MDDIATYRNIVVGWAEGVEEATAPPSRDDVARSAARRMFSREINRLGRRRRLPPWFAEIETVMDAGDDRYFRVTSVPDLIMKSPETGRTIQISFGLGGRVSTRNQPDYCSIKAWQRHGKRATNALLMNDPTVIRWLESNINRLLGSRFNEADIRNSMVVRSQTIEMVGMVKKTLEYQIGFFKSLLLMANGENIDELKNLAISESSIPRPTRRGIEKAMVVRDQRRRHRLYDEIRSSTANLAGKGINDGIIWWQPHGYGHELPISIRSIDWQEALPNMNVDDELLIPWIETADYADGTPMLPYEIEQINDDLDDASFYDIAYYYQNG